jgi:lipid-A-disaccharide synthase-like uncharacterized protein
MLADLTRAIGAYLQDVFIAKLDGWVALGLMAQFLFSMRFLVQWIASERAGRSVVPAAFWLFSIGGGTLLLIYSLYRKDPVYIAGQAAGLLIYFRNLEFLRREHRGRRKAATPAE